MQTNVFNRCQRVNVINGYMHNRFGYYYYEQMKIFNHEEQSTDKTLCIIE